MRRPFVLSARASEADTSSTTTRYAALPIQGGSYSDTLLHRLHITTYWAPFFLMLTSKCCASFLSSPGCTSASKGYHFENPTNHFWKSLHLSVMYHLDFPPLLRHIAIYSNSSSSTPMKPVIKYILFRSDDTTSLPF